MKGVEEFRLARYEFILEAVDNLFLPPYKGSTLRGGFGTAFRRIACSAGRADCRDCVLKAPCPYAYVFETMPMDGSEALAKFEHVPHPFVLEPPLTEEREFGPGDQLSVGLVLVGRGIEFLPYFIAAFQEFGRMGIGRGRGRFRLRNVYASVGVPHSQDKSGGDERRFQPGGSASGPIAAHDTSCAKEDNRACGTDGAGHSDNSDPRALVFDGKANKVYMRDAAVTWADIVETARGISRRLRQASDRGPEGGRPSTTSGPMVVSDSESASPVLGGTSACPAAAESRGSCESDPSCAPPRVTVVFRTMTRLKFQGGLEDRPEFHVLMRSLLRRASSLLYFHHGTRLDMDFRGFIARAELVELAAQDARWVDWERYSSRQDTRMKLGGLVGTATYEFCDADLAEFFLPWLILGEYIHVGKGCTFGLGLISLQPGCKRANGR
ncbi:MAG: CRISPR system precrRNA processing endoribonuclease RAMP protein Cas6 [Firmicutes bacterium]|nr:CRISPR system precrRNA processing endoribonuclease RAMP protein Cas6 [Bacillota bacterium]MDH7496395.1 CRISPR system precrRNA processing endoribonuclease RAMP protein Cas6 [Bacillota bacterium]